jgi:hypothetical protein
MLNSNVAFQLATNIVMVKNGSIEFKYKKDSSKNSFLINGEFKFIIDESVIFADYDPTKSDWQVYKKDNIEPGSHLVYWIYEKFNDAKSTLLASEIEVRFYGDNIFSLVY